MYFRKICCFFILLYCFVFASCSRNKTTIAVNAGCGSVNPIIYEMVSSNFGKIWEKRILSNKPLINPIHAGFVMHMGIPILLFICDDQLYAKTNDVLYVLPGKTACLLSVLNKIDDIDHIVLEY